MALPTIDRQFVETWSGHYRRGAESTPWRAGPKFRAAIATYPRMDPLASVTDYWTLEQHILGPVASAVQAAGSYGVAEFLTVGYWKSPRPLSRYLKNAVDPKVVPTQTAIALAPDVPDAQRAAVLSGLDGVQVRVASALLTVWDPLRYTVLDVWALKTLSAAGESINGISFGSRGPGWWNSSYDLYLEACRSIQNRVAPFTLRDLDRALWRWGRDN